MDKAPDAFRTISEVAQELDLPQHVLRFWETRFAQIKPMKRGGGRRYYRPDDVDLLRGIRYLLYGEGYTIRGVQRLLKENGGRFVQSVWQSGAPQPEPPDDRDADDDASGETFTALPPASGLALSSEDDDQPVPSALLRRANARRVEAADAALQPAQVNGEAVEPDDAPADEAEANSAHAGAGPDAAAGHSPGARLSRDDVRKLQATLFELGECRRLLEAALKDEL